METRNSLAREILALFGVPSENVTGLTLVCNANDMAVLEVRHVILEQQESGIVHAVSKYKLLDKGAK